MRSKKKFLFTFIIIFLWCDLNAALAQQYGWKVITKPTSRNLYAVEFVDSSHGWCAGTGSDGGKLYFTNDGGFTWQAATLPSNPNVLLDLSFSDLLHGWAIGNFYGNSGGLIWRTNNGGTFWTEQINPLFNTRRYLNTSSQSLTHNTTTGTKSSRADTGITIQTTNGGTTWKERTIADSISFPVGVGKIVFVDPLHGWVTAGVRGWPDAALLRTLDAGKTWKVIRTPYFAAISFIDTLRGWAVTGSPPTQAYRTTDGGVNWKQQGRLFDPMWDELHPTALSFVDSLNGWAFGGMFYRGKITEAIYHTTDGGRSWVQESVGLTQDFGDANDGEMLDRFHGWAVCNDGSVLRYQLITAVEEKLSRAPQRFYLHPNYPNPFNASTNIEYEVVQRASITITVYDVTGRKIQQLIGGIHEPGVYRIQFDGANLASGAYYYTMKTEQFSATHQMLLTK